MKQPTRNLYSLCVWGGLPVHASVEGRGQHLNAACLIYYLGKGVSYGPYSSHTDFRSHPPTHHNTIFESLAPSTESLALNHPQLFCGCSRLHGPHPTTGAISTPYSHCTHCCLPLPCDSRRHCPASYPCSAPLLPTHKCWNKEI